MNEDREVVLAVSGESQYVLETRELRGDDQDPMPADPGEGHVGTAIGVEMGEDHAPVIGSACLQPFARGHLTRRHRVREPGSGAEDRRGEEKRDHGGMIQSRAMTALLAVQ